MISILFLYGLVVADLHMSVFVLLVKGKNGCRGHSVSEEPEEEPTMDILAGIVLSNLNCDSDVEVWVTCSPQMLAVLAFPAGLGLLLVVICFVDGII
jgi:hypothetical protein